MFDPNAWAWPQWSLAIWLLLGLMIDAGLHGKAKVDPKGQPYTYNGFVAMVRTGIWVFFLLYGGFFAGRP